MVLPPLRIEDCKPVNLKEYALELAPRIVGYRLSRTGLFPVPSPINLTFSVTNMCHSRCKTCNIWRLYKKDRRMLSKELTIGEIESIFAGIGHVYFFNISGGEPFLRRDLPRIVGAACRYLTPRVIHTPTNALSPSTIEAQVAEILEIIESTGRPIHFTIKPSFDGVGPIHDEIRGVEGNFQKVLDTVSRLRKLKTKHPNLEVGLGTIISKFNLGTIGETARYAANMGVDSYISEIAEQRTELFNTDDPITPSAEEYETAIKAFNAASGPVSASGGSVVSSMTLAFRQVYYRIASRIMKEQRQALPCYAGSSNVHISPYGDVWPCCVLGYDKSMGNLRDHGYEFYSIWRSEEARDIRRHIARGDCHCPLANQAYSNILCSPSALLQVIRERWGGR